MRGLAETRARPSTGSAMPDWSHLLQRFRRIPLVASAVLTLSLLSGAAAAQETAAITGIVTHREAAPLGGVVVTLLPAEGGQRRTALTDAAGRYRISGLAAGRYRLRTDHIGMAAVTRELTLSPGEQLRLDLALEVAAIELEGIEVRAPAFQRRERERFDSEPGVTARVVGGRELKFLPGLAEADVLRAIEVLPGVVSTSDFSSAFNVRGGSADQNLILLDGIPIFNPFHLGGLFSVFNSDVIAGAEMLAGGFGAEYGGRVSSVLTVESVSETPDRLRVDAGVSLIATRASVRGAVPAGLPRLLGGEEGSWFVSGRRSYFDRILPESVRFPYHLTDVQAGSTLGTAGGGRLRFTGYTGRDVLDLTDFGSGEDATSILRVQWNWGNDVLGARWEQPLGAWRLHARLGYSRFTEALALPDFDDTRFASRIAQWTSGADLRRPLGAEATLKVGGSADRMSYQNLARSGGTEFFAREDAGVLAAGYLSLLWSPPAWLVEPGVRVDGWFAGDTLRSAVSPRLAVKRFLGAEGDMAVKASVGRYVQFLHSVRDEEFPISNDTWVLADRVLPHVVSDQVQLGVERFWGERWYLSLEGYRRSFDGVIAFNVANDPNTVEDDFLQGRGSSYGVDLLARGSGGRASGFVAASFLRATRTYPDPLAEGWDDLPPEVTYAPIFDRRLNLDLVLRYSLPWSLEAGARWNFGSGLPYTRPVGQFADWDQDLARGAYRFNRQWWSDGDEAPLYVVLGDRNAERYPAYHRLDVTVRRPVERSWGVAVPYLQILNLYNQQNVLFYFYNFDRTPATRSGISMFPVLPAVGVEVSF
jgi:hypothetical protein